VANEEIGLDITDLIKPDMYFDLFHFMVKTRYYVIINVDMNVVLKPNVFNKIEQIKWFPIDDIFHNIDKYGMTPFNIKIFGKSVSRLKRFLANYKG